MGAIAVTAEILSIGITEVRRSLKPNELGQHHHRQPAENLRFSKVYSGHPPHQVRSRIGNWWDGLFRISRKETAPNEHLY